MDLKGEPKDDFNCIAVIGDEPCGIGDWYHDVFGEDNDDLFQLDNVDWGVLGVPRLWSMRKECSNIPNLFLPQKRVENIWTLFQIFLTLNVMNNIWTKYNQISPTLVLLQMLKSSNISTLIARPQNAPHNPTLLLTMLLLTMLNFMILLLTFSHSKVFYKIRSFIINMIIMTIFIVVRMY